MNIGGTLLQGNANTFTPTETTTGTYTYYAETVYAENETCVSATRTAFTLTINSFPTAAIDITENSGEAANDAIICIGENATLTASGGSSYNWSTDETTASIIVSETDANTYNYTVTVTENGCESTASVEVTVEECTISCPSNILSLIHI